MNTITITLFQKEDVVGVNCGVFELSVYSVRSG